MSRTSQLRFELERELRNKVIFKKEWLDEDMTEEQEELYSDLYNVLAWDRHGEGISAKIIALEGKYFEGITNEDETLYVEADSVDLEALEWFIEQPKI